MKIPMATDGSTFSHAAVARFCQLIAAKDAALKIVSAYSKVMPLDEFAQSIEYAEQLAPAQRTQAESAAEKTVDAIRACLPGSKPELTTKVCTGNPPQVIVETAKDRGADLILTGTHGRGFWNRRPLGSVSEAVVHHAPCPGLVIRGDKVYSDDMRLE